MSLSPILQTDTYDDPLLLFSLPTLGMMNETLCSAKPTLLATVPSVIVVARSF